MVRDREERGGLVPSEFAATVAPAPLAPRGGGASSPAAALLSPPRGFTRVPVGAHSSFECTAGSQVFDVALQETQLPEFPPADDVFMRVCLLRDVCFIGGRLTYYVDAELDAATPSNCRISALTESRAGFVLPSYLKGHAPVPLPHNPTLVVGPRPLHVPFAPSERTFMLGELSHAECQRGVC